MRFLRSVLLLLTLTGLVFKSQAQVRHKKTLSKTQLAASVAAGKVVYMQNCSTCHQADGGGVQNMNPPLIKTEYVLGDKVRLVKIVLNGFNEDVEINGQTYSNNMPAHDFLNDKQIADVLTYVRNSYGNKASALSVKLVKNVRMINKK